MPSDIATGAKIGASSMIAGLLSRNIPQHSKMTLISNNNKMRFSVDVSSKLVMACGICSLASNQLNKEVAAMIEEIAAVLIADLKKISGKSFSLISL